MEKVVSLLVNEGGERIDWFVADSVPQLSRTAVQRLIDEGMVTVNGSVPKSSLKVAAGDVVVVRVPPAAPVETLPEAIPLDIVYEDADILVVNKPAGMVVHPAHGHSGGTLVNAVLAHCPDLPGVGGEQRPGIVHRLDKDTSGLIVVAKHDAALQNLQAQWKRRDVKKVYIAMVEGKVEPRTGLIDAPIGRDPKQRKRMAVVHKGSREAQTHYRVLEYLPGYTLLEAEPKTGRTHQIRVHMAFIDHPIVGDAVYGHRKQVLGITRHFLHAARLGLHLPGTGEWKEFEAGLPEELEGVVAAIRNRA